MYHRRYDKEVNLLGVVYGVCIRHIPIEKYSNKHPTDEHRQVFVYISQIDTLE